MKAKYFYERLLNYDKESWKTLKFYYGYSGDDVMIHHKNNNSEWYTVNRSGWLTKENIDGSREKHFCNIKDLIGDDFELFSTIQILKSGYLVLEDDVNITDRRVVYKLCEYIESLDTNPISYLFNDERHTDIPRICGKDVCINGMGYFLYYDKNGVEVEVYTIDKLKKENAARIYYDAKPIPYIKNMDNAVHVSFVCDMDDYKNNLKLCNEALQNLIAFMDTINIKCKWVNCKTKYPIYL